MMGDKRIEDYGFIGNMRSAALIDRDARMEWLCLPRFDSDACCAALLGNDENGYWHIRPAQDVTARSRRYRGETLVLETKFETASGCVAVIDFMPLPRERDAVVDVVRIVEGRRGTVDMTLEACFRFDYGCVVPWISYPPGKMLAVSGPDALRLQTPVALRDEASVACAEFTVAAGQRVPFVLSWYRSFTEEPAPLDAERGLADIERWWREWSGQCEIAEEYREPVVRSLITLKGLTDKETGGIIGAASCSLPEKIGGGLNWDYRYTWLRDATFTLYALLSSGYREEARAWRRWLLRAVGGDPANLQPLYGVAGERRLAEYELDWLAGFNGCRPVRVGNEAYRQQQLDVLGEVMDGLHFGRMHDLEPNDDLWTIQCRLIDYLEQHWQERDASLWERRGPCKHYIYSKVMAWVAVDRAIKGVERFGLDGRARLERWRALRRRIHDEVCERGFDKARNTFTQAYDVKALDASLLLLPLVGFLPADDPRMVGTVEAIQRELVHEGFVYRFAGDDQQRDLTAGEGAFLVCCFWLVDNLILLKRLDEAKALFDKLLAIRNDLGLLSEEYHPVERCLLGNFPQAFSHLGLINSAHNLSRALRGEKGPAQHRGDQ